MKHSEFNWAVATVFGEAYGDSLCRDLVLPAIGKTAREAIEAGVNPGTVWKMLLEETGADPQLAHVHRYDLKELKKLKMLGKYPPLA